MAFRTLEDGRVVARSGSLSFLQAAETRAITELDKTLTELGLDGWELVSHIHSDQPLQAETFYFKREIGD